MDHVHRDAARAVGIGDRERREVAYSHADLGLQERNIDVVEPLDLDDDVAAAGLAA